MRAVRATLRTTRSASATLERGEQRGGASCLLLAVGGLLLAVSGLWCVVRGGMRAVRATLRTTHSASAT